MNTDQLFVQFERSVRLKALEEIMREAERRNETEAIQRILDEVKQIIG